MFWPVTTCEGGGLRVHRGDGVVALCDSPQSCATVIPLRVATAMRLVELIDRAAEVRPAGRQLIGSLPTAEGRALHLLRSSCHLSLHDDPEPTAHSGWAVRYADQVDELRAALVAAIDAEPQAPADGGEAVLVEGANEIPERPAPPARTQRTTGSNAPEGRRAPGHAVPA